MLYSISGVVQLVGPGYAVVETGGLGYKIHCPLAVLTRIPAIGQKVHLLLHHQVREDANDLYGFLTDEELSLFGSLISISGVGPKSAMGIMSVAPAGELIAAINGGRVDLLTKASGVGKKTAERVVLELKGKLSAIDNPAAVGQMEKDADLEETLISLGYSKAQARAAIGKIDPKTVDFNDRLKAVLRDYKK